jgi:hypothetical protein
MKYPSLCDLLNIWHDWRSDKKMHWQDCLARTRNGLPVDGGQFYGHIFLPQWDFSHKDSSLSQYRKYPLCKGCDPSHHLHIKARYWSCLFPTVRVGLTTARS